MQTCSGRGTRHGLSCSALSQLGVKNYESAFIAFIALALKVPGGVHTLASATEVRGYAAFVDVCAKVVSRQQVSIRTALLLVATC